MASRTPDTAGRLLVARLDGTARRLAIEGASLDDAVPVLQAITTDPALLGQAAGAFMARHREHAPTNPFARPAADLLLAAGADLAVAEHEAEQVAQRIRTAAVGGWRSPTA